MQRPHGRSVCSRGQNSESGINEERTLDERVEMRRDRNQEVGTERISLGLRCELGFDGKIDIELTHYY